MTNKDNTYNWKKVWSCEDGMEAQLIKNLMEINDIPVNLMNVNSNSMFPDSSIAEVDIYVPEEYVNKAKELIEQDFE